jgi:hypothetical protein
VSKSTFQDFYTKCLSRQSSHGEMAEGMALIVTNFVPEITTKASSR